MFRFRPAIQSVAKSTKVLVTPSSKFGTYKSSTGLVGLAVDANGRETLQKISEQILQSVKVNFMLKTLERSYVKISFRYVIDRESQKEHNTERMLRNGSATSKMSPLRKPM